MKNYVLYGLAICFSLFILSACTKDLDEITTIDNIPEPSVKVSASFLGLIVDEQAIPVADARVKIGSENAFSDENGFFKLTGLFDDNGTFIEIQKQGFFDAYGSVIPVKEGTVQVKFILKARNNTGTTSSNKAYVHTADNFQVSFQKDSYQTLQKEAYTGTVTVRSTFLDPTTDNFSSEYVGKIIGKSGEQVTLVQPIGLINLELFSENDAPLQIGNSAKIKMKVPAALQNKVLSEASLWYLDTELGIWVEEGMATLNGDSFEGTVEHFTLWCIGTGQDLETVTVSGQITQGGNAYPNARLGHGYNAILRSEFYADENGNYVIEVLKNAGFRLEVLDDCRSSLTSVTEEMGILDDKVINLEVPLTANSVTISGTLTDCDNNPVANGYVLLSYQENKFNQVLLANENGQYQLNFENCNTEDVLLKGFDAGSGLTSANLAVQGNGIYDLSTCATTFQGELIFSITGELPYVINNCTFTKEKIIAAGLEVDQYKIKALDLFPTYPELTGALAEYGFTVLLRPDPLAPAGPIELPEASENAPILFTFPPINPIQNSVTEDLIDITFEYDENSLFSISRSFTGVNDLYGANEMKFKGSVQIKAILQE